MVTHILRQDGHAKPPLADRLLQLQLQRIRVGGLHCVEILRSESFGEEGALANENGVELRQSPEAAGAARLLSMRPDERARDCSAVANTTTRAHVRSERGCTGGECKSDGESIYFNLDSREIIGRAYSLCHSSSCEVFHLLLFAQALADPVLDSLSGNL